jgi:hypothetical protein
MDTLTPSLPFQAGLTVEGEPVVDKLQAANIARLIGARSIEEIGDGVWLVEFDEATSTKIAARVIDGGEDITFGFTWAGRRTEIEIPGI